MRKIKMNIKRVVASVLTLSMVLTLQTPFTSGSSGTKTVKAAITADVNDGSQGLTELTQLSTTSVDGTNVVKFWKNSSDKYLYSVYRNDKVVIECSEIGLVTKANDLTTGLTLDESSIAQKTGKEEYDTVHGSQSHISKEYKDTAFTLTKGNSKMTVRFRVFADGIAYRYEVDGDTTSTEETTEITSENSNFVLPGSGTYWTIPQSATYEAGEYTKRDLSTLLSKSETYSTPLLANYGENNGNYWVLLSEANVFNEENPYCSSIFETKSNSRAIKVKFSGYLKQEQDATLNGKKFSPTYGQITSVLMNDVFHTPWRVAIISDNLEGVTNSSLIADVNPAPKGDFSWVKPGTSSWSWWSGSKDNIGYESMFDYIDFAAESKMQYCLVDYGWELWSDYQTKVKNLVEYADAKGVYLILWYGVHKFDNAHIFDLVTEEAIESAFSWCESVGVKGVKVDYINSDSQFAMKNMYLIADIAAKHKLVVNYHGASDPNGESRTYPNILANEAVQGMEYYKWSNGMPIASLLTLPFTRNVIGSMEYTPAAYRNSKLKTTYGFMLAEAIVFQSTVQTLAASAYVYPGYNGLSLIKGLPASWDDSKLISGYPGSNVIRARRSGENWYIGAMTNEAGKYDVSLDFLEPNTIYNAYIYEENEAGDNIEITSEEVTSETVLELDLIQGDGCAVKITKDDPIGTTVYDGFKYYEAENAELAGAAKIVESNYVSGLKYVDSIGSNAANTVTFRNVRVREDGEYDMKLYVLTGSPRNISVKANDEEPVLVNKASSPNTDSSAVGVASTKIHLNAGDNTIVLSNSSSAAPAIDRIAVSKLDITTGSEVTLEKEQYDYTGNPFKPAVTVKKDGSLLVSGTDYTVTYFNNVKGGTATVSIMGIGDFAGTITKTFTIVAPSTPAPTLSPAPNPTVAPTPVPATATPTPVVTSDTTKPSKVAIVSVKSAKKKQMTVTYKKVKKANGYQITYSESKKFSKSKNVLVGSTVTKKTISKLKSKKTYYVHVRAYKTANGKKIYGTWSNSKKVKIK